MAIAKESQLEKQLDMINSALPKDIVNQANCSFVRFIDSGTNFSLQLSNHQIMDGLNLLAQRSGLEEKGQYALERNDLAGYMSAIEGTLDGRLFQDIAMVCRQALEEGIEPQVIVDEFKRTNLYTLVAPFFEDKLNK